MPEINPSSLMKIMPEAMETLRLRVRVLKYTAVLEPIGRRLLAGELSLTERVLRSELELLRSQGLLYASVAGVSLTEEGRILLEELDPVIAEYEGRYALAQQVSRRLSIPEVIVVEGDSDDSETVKQQMGLQAALRMRRRLTPGDVLAVAGGTSMAAFAASFPRFGKPLPIKVVPARGGMGESVALQANAIAAEVAARLGGSSIMLHVPDRLKDETLEHLLADPYVRAKIPEIREATAVVHGIGDAITMAERRNASLEELALLRDRNAVAEAFGYYFDSMGDVVYSMTTVGLSLADVRRMRCVAAIAGGRKKAIAVAAAAKAFRMDLLVTDEGAARYLLEP